MAIEGEGDNALSYTRKWFEKVDRGGLFPTNDKAFHLFVEIEKSVRTYHNTSQDHSQTRTPTKKCTQQNSSK